jgi:hypothetical protein
MSSEQLILFAQLLLKCNISLKLIIGDITHQASVLDGIIMSTVPLISGTCPETNLLWQPNKENIKTKHPFMPTVRLLFTFRADHVHNI